MNLSISRLLYGPATYIPGVYRHFSMGGGCAESAEYCYTYWLRHLNMIFQNSSAEYPKVIAELGPGSSLGIGIAALISGVEKYYALDIMEHHDLSKNVAIFDELVALFKNKTDITLNDFYKDKDISAFPKSVLTDKHLETALNSDRIKRLREDIVRLPNTNESIQYCVPWYDSTVIKSNIVDTLISTVALEHIDDLEQTYGSMYSWLKPGGVMSHIIGYLSHGSANEWNGHWAYSDFIWRVMRGNRPYFINRQPHSTHIRLLEKYGFEFLCDLKFKETSNLKAADCAPRFRELSDEDLSTIYGHILARKVA